MGSVVVLAPWQLVLVGEVELVDFGSDFLVIELAVESQYRLPSPSKNSCEYSLQPSDGHPVYKHTHDSVPGED
jgi:hypothetical protein